MDVIFTDKDSSNQTHKAVHEIENIVGDKGLVAGSAVSDTNLGPTINKEVARVMALAVVIIYIILTITTTSWFEPVLFLSVLSALQSSSTWARTSSSARFRSCPTPLVRCCSWPADGLLHLPAARLHAGSAQPVQNPNRRWRSAWRTAFSSIGASGMTTIVGFAAMALMNFGIGPDMGFVLAKGIALSLLTVLLLMPALILRSQNIIAKTQHRPFIPKQGRGIGEFAYKIRRIVFCGSYHHHSVLHCTGYGEFLLRQRGRFNDHPYTGLRGRAADECQVRQEQHDDRACPARQQHHREKR